MLVVGSEHSLEAIDHAYGLLEHGGGALEAVIAATRLVEDDLRVRSVGTGGYPNLAGIVELDASLMEGTRRRAGAVGALGGFRHPIEVARLVMERLPHVLLAGEGAARFAAEVGAERAELLTEEARHHWEEGMERARAAAGEDVLAQALQLTARPDDAVGTVDILALDGRGRIASAVSTSGWPFRWPGRLGDSPIIGAGNYCDDRYGAAGCTGFGELAIRAGTARCVVAALAAGASPEQAGRAALEDVWSLVGSRHEVPMNVVVLDAAGRHAGLATLPGGYYAWRDESVTSAVRAERVVVSRQDEGEVTLTGYVLRRLAHAVLVLLGVTIITFVLESLVATGPQLARAVIGVRATPGLIHSFEVQYGLDHPLPVQYLQFIWHLLHGNLGYSYKLDISVDTLVVQDLPTDVLLVGSAIVIAVAIALPIGIAQAVRRNRSLDYAGTGLSFLLYSMPTYWLALLLVELFAVTWHLVPPGVQAGAGFAQVVAQPRALVLPIATLVLVNFALFSRYMRSSAIEQLAEDYIRTARAKGVGERAILARHLLRNALSPLVTLVGLSLPAILTAGLVVEYVFNFPGIGLAYYNAAVSSDYPVLLGITVLVGVVTVVGNLLADVGYAVLDPRVRYGRPGR